MDPEPGAEPFDRLHRLREPPLGLDHAAQVPHERADAAGRAGEDATGARARLAPR